MKIKKFTLLTLALLVSAVAFAQKANVSLDKSRVLMNDILPKLSVAATSKTNPIPVEQNTTNRANAPRKAETVTPPSGLDAEYFVVTGDYHTYSSSGWSDTKSVERTVKVYWDGDDVYIQGIDYYAEEAFVKGTFTDDNTVVFPKGQYLGNVGADVYFGAVNDDNDKIDATATFDPETNTFTFVDAVATLNVALTGMYAYGENVVVAPAGDDVDIPVEPPTDLVTEDWAYSGVDYWEGTDVSKIVKVGFYGEDVYFQGFCEYLPEAWLKGTIVGNEITLPGYQYYGNYRGYDLYMRGLAGESFGEGDVIFNYDEAAQKMTTEYAIFLTGINSDGGGGNFAAHKNVVLSKVAEKAATPKAPVAKNMLYTTYGPVFQFETPMTDVNGEGLVSSKLAYQLYYEDEFGTPTAYTFTKELYNKIEEDMTEVPVDFSDEYDFFSGEVYMKMDISNWDKVGIKSIYHGGGETHESPITWYTIPHPVVIDAPVSTTITTNEFNATDDKGNAVKQTVNVAIDGDNLYIKNIAGNDEWIKGVKKDASTFIFEKGQEMGTYSSYILMLVGAESNSSSNTLDITVKVDAANNVYKFETPFAVNAGYIDKLYYLNYYEAGATISMESVDGIESVKAEEKSTNDATFNIAGQRVNDTYKGLVIKDGKKFIVK